jgi:hypothetical protein
MKSKSLQGARRAKAEMILGVGKGEKPLKNLASPKNAPVVAVMANKMK